jgi:hypothetical protein
MVWFSAYSAPVQSRISKELAAYPLSSVGFGIGEARQRLSRAETLLGITRASEYKSSR